MKILILEEFDCAGLCLNHRDALRALGHDFRVALHAAYNARHRDADWVAYAVDGTPLPCDRESLRAFAAEADCIQICPGIGSPWAEWEHHYGPSLGLEFPEAPLLDIDWHGLRLPENRIALFHGSASFRAQRERYVNHFAEQGCRIAATTLEDTVVPGTVYLPPAMPGNTGGATPREDGAPLVVAHTTTYPRLTGTTALRQACADLDVELRFIARKSHAEALALKRSCNAGFDHMRGSFSTNHLENCALGLASLCGLFCEHRERLLMEGFRDMPVISPIHDLDSLRDALRSLRDDAALTRDLGHRCKEWVEQFDAANIGPRLVQFYEGKLGDPRA